MPGKPGVKIINEDEARILRRIFSEYASRKSPRLIAADLMRGKVPSPTGSAFWNCQTIVGGAGKKRGLLNNMLYVGVYLKKPDLQRQEPGPRQDRHPRSNPG